MAIGKIPLVYYDNKENRVVVGEAEVVGNQLRGTITDPAFSEKLFQINYGHFSFVHDGEYEGD